VLSGLPGLLDDLMFLLNFFNLLVILKELGEASMVVIDNLYFKGPLVNRVNVGPELQL